ncbi:hypothetical protein LMH73_008805 [Vibrio splendidus]|nr:hypothetical protein [Vibrio splendidus]MCC4878475.1 hypothetical protein [Vibrio splendidus]
MSALLITKLQSLENQLSYIYQNFRDSNDDSRIRDEILAVLNGIAVARNDNDYSLLSINELVGVQKGLRMFGDTGDHKQSSICLCLIEKIQSNQQCELPLSNDDLVYIIKKAVF